MNKYILLGLIVFSFTACKPKKNVVSLRTLADTAAYFSKQIINIEKTLNLTDIDAYLAGENEIKEIKNHANTVIQSYFEKHNIDTLFLQFNQSKNIGKFKIQKLWVTSASFNKLCIEAKVYAMDNSAQRGVYIGFAAKERYSGRRIECGGGIAAPDSVKIHTGETYIFSGSIEKLSELSHLRTILFDEEIQRW